VVTLQQVGHRRVCEREALQCGSHQQRAFLALTRIARDFVAAERGVCAFFASEVD
jgi:hypothetical protein